MILAIYRSIAVRLKAFANKHELNEHLSAHVFKAGKQLRGNYRKVLDILSQHAVCVSGVAWIGEDTIAKALGVCERTVKRAIDRLESLGIGRREIVTADGMTFRYFVFNKFELSAELSEELSEVESVTEPVVSTDEAAFSSAETKETRETKTDDEYINTYGNPIFVNSLKNGIPCREAIRLVKEIGFTDYHPEAIDITFTKVIDRYFSGAVAVLPKYFRTVLEREHDRIIHAEKVREEKRRQAESFPFYNWLEADRGNEYHTISVLTNSK